MANKSFRLTLPILRSESNSSSEMHALLLLLIPPTSLRQNPAPETQISCGRYFATLITTMTGRFPVEELRAYFKSVGDSISEEEAEKVIKEFDKDGDNLLEFNDFVQLMRKDSKDGGLEDIKKAFEVFEVDKGSGCITPKGLQVVLNRLGGSKSLDECKAMIRVFDLDGNGVLDFDEFHKMMS